MSINPVVFALGDWQIRLFTGAILLSAAIGIGWLMWCARQNGESPLRWLDAALGLAIGGLIGGRAAHVLLAWSYFSVQRDQIADLSNGGFDWHGALIGGLLCAGLIALVRRIRWSAFSDALALWLPIGAMAIWGACGGSACAVGQEVRTLADYPAWLVTESPDVYGQIAPRYNLPQLGVWFGVALWVLIAIIAWRGLFNGRRLWLAIALLSAGQALLDGYRGDAVAFWAGQRADQILDILVMLLAIIALMGGKLIELINDERSKRRKYERHNRAGTDLSQNRAGGRESGKAP